MTRCPLTTRRDGVAHSYGKGPSGRKPSAATVNLRLAAISSLHGFLLRMGLVAVNPCDRVQRTKQEPPPARGLDQGEIRRLVAADSLGGL